jgi:hypothetical protein
VDGALVVRLTEQNIGDLDRVSREELGYRPNQTYVDITTESDLAPGPNLITDFLPLGPHVVQRLTAARAQ